MRFLVDNSLSPRLAVLLEKSGHQAMHVRQLGLAAADDQTIFAAAARQGQVIIAQDTDFGTILALRQERFPSLILFRCQAKSTEAIFRLLQANLPPVVSDLDNGAVVVIEDARIRVRQLPIAGS
jgi:predicted nuclease of predicted toxin-antitoxin system